MSDFIKQTDIDIKQVEQDSADIVNQMFYKLKLIFPAWRQNFKTESEFLATKALWLETLIDEGVTTQEQIDRGLKAARNYPSAFFPSVGQFVTWSKKVKPRVNEAMYQEFTFQISPHTRDEYKEMGDKGMKKLKDNLNN